MDFVIENYIWFLIIGVVLVMALIGYIAEKTDFVKEKEPKEKKQKKSKKNVKEVAEETKEEPQLEQSEVAPQPEVPQSTTGTAMDWELPSTVGEVSSSSVDDISNIPVDVMNDMSTSTVEPGEMSSLPEANLEINNDSEEEVVDLSDVTTQLEPQLAEAKFQIAPEPEEITPIDEKKTSAKQKKGKKKKETKETSVDDNSSLDDIWKF